MMDDFCVFILSHGRPDKILTLKALQRQGYTGNVRIVVDDNDKTMDKYIEMYGDSVCVFSKKDVVCDTMDIDKPQNVILYARNVCFDIAKRIGVKYFMELDDDYTYFGYRYPDGNILRESVISNMDSAIGAMLDFYKRNQNITCLAMCQGGDLLGGVRDYNSGPKRKAMNALILSTDREFRFAGSINEDVNTYASMGNKGSLFFTIFDINLHQLRTQQNSGGMTDTYVDTGTYRKAMYSVMACPSFVKVAAMVSKYPRIHHKINWNCGVPKIISSRYKKV